MIIAIGMGSYSVQIVNSATTYDSGVEWRTVGDYWRPLDHGADAAKIECSALCMGSVETIDLLAASIASMQIGGGTATVTCESFESIFGPHIAVQPLPCLLEAGELDTVDSNGREMGLLQIRFIPLDRLDSLYVTAGNLSAGPVMVQSVSRDFGSKYALTGLLTGSALQGFYTLAPSTSVEVICSQAVAAALLVFLEQARGTPFVWPHSTAQTYLFSSGDLSPSCYCLSHEYQGPLAVNSRWHRIQINLGAA